MRRERSGSSRSPSSIKVIGLQPPQRRRTAGTLTAHYRCAGRLATTHHSSSPLQLPVIDVFSPLPTRCTASLSAAVGSHWKRQGLFPCVCKWMACSEAPRVLMRRLRSHSEHEIGGTPASIGHTPQFLGCDLRYDGDGEEDLDVISQR